MESDSARSCEKNKVAISGCAPLKVSNFTVIAQTAVGELFIGPILAISKTPKESIEKKPGL